MRRTPFGEKGAASVLNADEEHRKVRKGPDLRRRGAEDRGLEAAPAVRAHDDHVGVVLRVLRDLFGRAPRQADGFGFDVGLLENVEDGFRRFFPEARVFRFAAVARVAKNLTFNSWNSPRAIR